MSVSELLAGPHVADLALLALVAEGAVLLGFYAFSGRGLRPAELASALLPGACLLLALRCALAANGEVGVCLFLAAALLAHLVDMRRRFRLQGRQSGAQPATSPR